MNKHKALAIVSLVSLAALLPACQSIELKVNQPLPAQEDSAAFLDRISSVETVTENDAFRSIIILLQGEDKSASFAERTQFLRSRNIVAKEWDFVAERPITKGKLAYMLCQACDIKGGVTMLLTGPTQRYCLRELQYERMISDGAIYNVVTGMELVGIIQRADAYRQQREVPRQYMTPPLSTGS